MGALFTLFILYISDNSGDPSLNIIVVDSSAWGSTESRNFESLITDFFTCPDKKMSARLMRLLVLDTDIAGVEVAVKCS